MGTTLLVKTDMCKVKVNAISNVTMETTADLKLKQPVVYKILTDTTYWDFYDSDVEYVNPGSALFTISSSLTNYI